jgi:hypothetical protein
VLITDAATLAGLSERDRRLRCADCGEMHLIQRDVSSAIVGVSAKL